MGYDNEWGGLTEFRDPLICRPAVSLTRSIRLLLESVDGIIVQGIPMIEQMRAKIQAQQFEFSKHAVDNTILRQITVQELREAIGNGEIIEDYPHDKYGPSCLVLGFTQRGRPLHIQCSYPSRPLIKIITLYEPDPNEWIDFKVRRT